MTRLWMTFFAAAVLVVATAVVGAAQQEYIEDLRARAEQGDVNAQHNLGLRYFIGQGVPLDDAEAVRWFRLAADQGYANSQYALGTMYVDGKGVPEDDVEAARLFRLAANQGHARGQYRFGYAYLSGRGVPQDDAEAVRWFRLAADQGDAAGQTALGILYQRGELVPEDQAESHRLFQLAAGQGNVVAQFELGFNYHAGAYVQQDLAEAARLYLLAADQGHVEAQNRIARWYLNGTGVPQDDVQAHKWFNLAASKMTGRFRESAVKSRDEVASRLTPDQRAEAQRLAREWTARVTVPSISPRIEDVPPSGSEGGKGGTEQQINIAEVLRSQEFRRAVARVVSEHCHYTGIVAPGPVNCFDTPIGTRRSSPSSSYAELLGSQEFRRAVARVVGNGGCNYMGLVNFGSGIIPPGPINCVGIGRSTSLRRPGSALLRSQEFGPAVARVVNNNCNYIGGVIISGGFIPPGPIDCGVPR